MSAYRKVQMAAAWLCAALSVAAFSSAAQETGSDAAQSQVNQAIIKAQIVTLDRDRLFSETKAGRAVIAGFERESAALVAENRTLEAALEEEERQLTARRPTMPAEEFRKLANEFDTKVEELRTAQDSKSRILTRRREEGEQAFFESAVPVLGRLMVELNVVAIVDRSAIILTFDQLDITDLAIARLDSEFDATPAPSATPEGGAPTGTGNNAAPDAAGPKAP